MVNRYWQNCKPVLMKLLTDISLLLGGIIFFCPGFLWKFLIDLQNLWVSWSVGPSVGSSVCCNFLRKHQFSIQMLPFPSNRIDVFSYWNKRTLLQSTTSTNSRMVERTHWQNNLHSIFIPLIIRNVTSLWPLLFICWWLIGCLVCHNYLS